MNAQNNQLKGNPKMTGKFKQIEIEKKTVWIFNFFFFVVNLRSGPLVKNINKKMFDYLSVRLLKKKLNKFINTTAILEMKLC